MPEIPDTIHQHTNNWTQTLFKLFLLELALELAVLLFPDLRTPLPA